MTNRTRAALTTALTGALSIGPAHVFSRRLLSLSITALAGLGIVVASATPAAAQSTEYRAVVAQHSYKCLDVPSGSAANNVVIQQYTCHNGINQRWRFVYLNNGYNSIISVVSGKCLDVPSSSTTDGTAVQQYTCHGGANQQWAYLGGGRFAARHSGKCLEVRNGSTANNAVVQQYTCHGGQNQIWGLFS